MSYIIDSILARTGAVLDSDSYRAGWPIWHEAGGPIDAPRHLPLGGCYNKVFPDTGTVIIHDTTMRDGWYKSRAGA